MTPPKTLIGALLLALSLSAAGAAAAEADAPALAWSLCRQLEDVQAVFCHPTDPFQAWAATGAGLFHTGDEGKTWQAVEAASAAKLGLVTALAGCLADENRLIMGTQDKGVYLSTDGGKTWTRLGTETEKPASDHVDSLLFAADDPSWQTILVTHGQAAPGLSTTYDLGRTWVVMAKDRYLAKFVRNGQTIVAAGSLTSSEGRVWGIHRSGTEGFHWDHSSTGIRPTEVVATRDRWRFYFATLDNDILQSDNDGRTWSPLAQFESSSWASLFWAPGRTGSSRLLVGYDPRRQGVVLSTRNFLHGSLIQRNQGLYVGPFIKSGSSCRANSNGSTYYIVMNNALWIGRRAPDKEGPFIVQAWTSPSAIWVGRGEAAQPGADLHRHIGYVAAGEVSTENVRAIAAAGRQISQHLSAMGFRVQARLQHPAGLAALKSVTVDAFPLGGAPAAAMHDDGQHGDGQPGDGLFAADVRVSESLFAAGRDAQRFGFPGKGALTVTATDKAGKSDSWSAVVSIVRRPESISMFGHHFGESLGPVRLYHAPNEGLRPGAHAMGVEASGPGPWRAAWMASWNGGTNISGLGTLQFYIKGNTNQELFVQLVDRFKIGIDVFDECHFSQPVPLIAGGYLKAVTPTYQLVRVPVEKTLTKGTYYLRHHGAGVALSVGEGGKPGRYYLDAISLEP